jgi:aqualysin 1
VSSIIAGQTIGVAPDVNLHMVKVVNATGSGPLSATILGIQHVIQQQIIASRTAATNRTFILNISLGSIKSDAFVYAVELAVEYGVFVVMAAGNEAGSACQWTSGRAVSALTVGATTRDDRIAHYSNYGSCVDLYAYVFSILMHFPPALSHVNADFDVIGRAMKFLEPPPLRHEEMVTKAFRALVRPPHL